MRTLAERGDRVFLDLKFHDIPNTVAGAVASAVATGAWMVNVHASGGRAMMRAAGARPRWRPRTRLGRERPLRHRRHRADQPGRRGARAKPASSVRSAIRSCISRGWRRTPGLDGVVASPQEIAAIRARLRSGLRRSSRRASGPPDQAGTDDQARTMGPAEAIAAGATYLVIGRPITAAADPRAAAEQIAALAVRRAREPTPVTGSSAEPASNHKRDREIGSQTSNHGRSGDRRAKLSRDSGSPDLPCELSISSTSP